MIAGAKINLTLPGELQEKLTKELEVFRATFNKRVVYFAALQEISDLVRFLWRPRHFRPDQQVSSVELIDPHYNEAGRESYNDVLKKNIENCNKRITEHELKIARMTVKGRFLQYLGSRETNLEDLKEDCIICMGASDDKQGVLLDCGHFYCVVSGRETCGSWSDRQSCFRELRRSMQGRRCPSCRTESERVADTSYFR